MPFGLKRSVLSRVTTPSAATIPHFQRKGTLRLEECACVLRKHKRKHSASGRGADYPPSSLTNVWRTIALAISTKNAPTSGTTRNERGEAPYFLVVAVMMGMGVGVAPRAIPK